MCYQVEMPKHVKKAKAEKDAGVIKEGKTIFGYLLKSDLPPSEKSIQRLTDEATSLFAAGTETISWALAVITYHILSKPEMLQKLTVEIAQVVDSSGELPP